jgi:hypothetical protein
LFASSVRFKASFNFFCALSLAAIAFASAVLGASAALVPPDNATAGPDRSSS